MNFLLPEASAEAHETDLLLLALLGISVAVLVLVFGLMWTYIIRYRAGSTLHRGKIAKKTFKIEIGWTAATLLVFFGLFLWGADLYVRLFQPPAGSLQVYVIGKQWMWKVEHAGGQKEINALHVPVGRSVQLLMTSEDVIHDFSLPAFRIKHDVLPSRYETLWIKPTRIGDYPLYCTQFCGTDHAAMIGTVTVLSPPDYADWLARNGTSGGLVAEGHALFIRYGCSGCHQAQADGRLQATVRAPPLIGLYGSPVPLSDGTVVVADDRYLHDSIVMPGAQVVASYPNIMPSFQGQISEADIVKLVAFIKSLAAEPPPDNAAAEQHS